MKKKSLVSFCIAIGYLVAGAACHDFCVSEDSVKFKIGVIAGILMIIAAVSFAVAGIIVAVKDKKSR